MVSWAEMSIFACVRGWNRGKFGKRVANFFVSFPEWKQKNSQNPLRAFHEKRNVNSKLVSCFVSTFECHAKQPQKVGVSFLHDFPVSTLALPKRIRRDVGMKTQNTAEAPTGWMLQNGCSKPVGILRILRNFGAKILKIPSGLLVFVIL